MIKLLKILSTDKGEIKRLDWNLSAAKSRNLSTGNFTNLSSAKIRNLWLK